MIFPFKNLLIISCTLLSYVVAFRNVTEKDQATKYSVAYIIQV